MPLVTLLIASLMLTLHLGKRGRWDTSGYVIVFVFLAVVSGVIFVAIEYGESILRAILSLPVGS